MADETIQRLTVRLAVVENMLAELFAMTYRQLNLSAEDVARRHAHILSEVRAIPVPTDEPVVSDHVSAEIEEACKALLRKIENSLESPVP